MTFAFFRNLAKAKVFSIHSRRQIYILGIESSCDDTSAAVVNESGRVLGEGHFSQSRVHVETGGIIPTLASNLHKQYIQSVVDTSMRDSLLDFKDLNAIAVTVKPGLLFCLKEGLEFAKDLCTLYSKPLIPIHHMEAHALTARMLEDVKFPFLVFLVSGGHCILAIAKSVNEFHTLGNCIDRSPGSALDRAAKKARMRYLNKFRGMVGGVAVETAALEGDPLKFQFGQCAMGSQTKNCNFSFSGLLNTAEIHIDMETKNHKLGPDEVIPSVNDLCAGLLWSMTRHMCQRIEVAFKYIEMKGLLTESEKCLVMSGGVACNKFLQKMVKKVCDHYNYKFVVPPDKLCTDNGIMVAWNGMEKFRENLPLVQPDDLDSVTALSSCPFGEDLSEDVKQAGRHMSFKYMKFAP